MTAMDPTGPLKSTLHPVLEPEMQPSTVEKTPEALRDRARDLLVSGADYVSIRWIADVERLVCDIAAGLSVGPMQIRAMQMLHRANVLNQMVAEGNLNTDIRAWVRDAKILLADSMSTINAALAREQDARRVSPDVDREVVDDQRIICLMLSWSYKGPIHSPAGDQQFDPGVIDRFRIVIRGQMVDFERLEIGLIGDRRWRRVDVKMMAYHHLIASALRRFATETLLNDGINRVAHVLADTNDKVLTYELGAFWAEEG